jgi:hypothetical protein
MNEDALARLEAGLRAQRERLSSAPLQASPGLSPAPPECGPIDLPDFLKRDVEKASA